MADFYKLDLREASDEERFHSLILSAFGFPSYYGRNLDAFWDCLSEITGPAEVELVGYDSLNPTMTRYVDSYIETLNEFAQECSSGFLVKFSSS